MIKDSVRADWGVRLGRSKEGLKEGLDRDAKESIGLLIELKVLIFKKFVVNL